MPIQELGQGQNLTAAMLSQIASSRQNAGVERMRIRTEASTADKDRQAQMQQMQMASEQQQNSQRFEAGRTKTVLKSQERENEKDRALRQNLIEQDKTNQQELLRLQAELEDARMNKHWDRQDGIIKRIEEREDKSRRDKQAADALREMQILMRTDMTNQKQIEVLRRMDEQGKKAELESSVTQTMTQSAQATAEGLMGAGFVRGRMDSHPVQTIMGSAYTLISEGKNLPANQLPQGVSESQVVAARAALQTAIETLRAKGSSLKLSPEGESNYNSILTEMEGSLRFLNHKYSWVKPAAETAKSLAAIYDAARKGPGGTDELLRSMAEDFKQKYPEVYERVQNDPVFRHYNSAGAGMSGMVPSQLEPTDEDIEKSLTKLPGSPDDDYSKKTLEDFLAAAKKETKAGNEALYRDQHKNDTPNPQWKVAPGLGGDSILDALVPRSGGYAVPGRGRGFRA